MDTADKFPHIFYLYLFLHLSISPGLLIREDWKTLKLTLDGKDVGLRAKKK
jgi:hypothetical protein